MFHFSSRFVRFFRWALPLFAATAIRAGSAPIAVSTPAPADSSAAAAPAPERFSWTGKLGAGAPLIVRNPHGDIRARFGGTAGKVEVLAVLQHLTKADPPLRVMIGETAGKLTVTVGYPAAAGKSAPASAAASAPATLPPPAGRPDRADLVVFVPKGTLLDVESGAGLVEAKGLESDVTAHSDKGEIWLRVSGRVEARSERGSLTVFLDPAEKRPQRLETLTGDITAHIREGASLEIEAATSGEITTDFSLRMERRPQEEPGKRAFVKVGSGGARLALSSKRGTIRMLWLDALSATAPSAPLPRDVK